MVDWPTRSVEECLTKLRLGSVSKLQTQDYRPSGRFPIIDQGQSLIAGWTNDDSGLIDHDLPVVVFGDHTRAFKYVDFPFVRGADGTQVLKPTSDIDPLFFFYALRGIDLPSRGYNRHFKALKEKEVSIPEAAEQADIARTLRLVEASLEIQEQQVLSWERCKRAAMRALFTKGLRGEAQKETEIGPVPERWEVVSIGSVFSIVQGLALKGNLGDDKNGVPFLRTSNVYWNCINHTKVSRMRVDPELVGERRLEPGDLLVCEGGEIGRSAVWTGGVDGLCTYQNHLHRLRPILPSVVIPQFAAAWLEVGFLMRGIYEGAGNKTTIPNLSRARLSELRMPLPTLDEQREIVAILDAIDCKIDLHRRKRAVLDELFKALLHKLMTGEIRVADLDLSALVAKPVAEAAA